LPLTFHGSLGLHMDELAWDNNAFVMVLTIGLNESSEDYGEMETFLGFLSDIWECIDGIRWRVNQWENSICCTSQNLGHIQSLSKDFSFEDAKTRVVQFVNALWKQFPVQCSSFAYRARMTYYIQILMPRERPQDYSSHHIPFKISCP
jgi:hypothetical protein